MSIRHLIKSLPNINICIGADADPERVFSTTQYHYFCVKNIHITGILG